MKIFEGLLGVLDHIFKPNLKNQWGGPFNGQRYRQKIFFDILHASSIKVIVETGTYLGYTTALFAATTVPVYSVERSKRAYYYSKTKFFFQKDIVHLFHSDSRPFLSNLLARQEISNKNIFFYLDAHWGKRNLPLLEELEIIFSTCELSVVMIDDFCVPNSEYKYDSYGKKRTLELDYIQPVLDKYNLAIFFPAVPADQETGGKAGCVILCSREQAKLLKEVNSLRAYSINASISNSSSSA